VASALLSEVFTDTFYRSLSFDRLKPNVFTPLVLCLPATRKIL